MPERILVEVAAGESTTALHYPAPDKRPEIALILGHGAGANQSNAFMVDFATALASRGIEVFTFNFLYTEQKRRIPDPTPKLEACYRAVIAAARTRIGMAALFIGGKSMGGRIASHLAAAGEAGVAGLVLLGYPLHPPGRPDKLRIKHLGQITMPVQIVQGAKDAFGTPEELRPAIKTIKGPVELVTVEDGDHSYKVPKRSGRSPAMIQDFIIERVADWLRGAANRV